MTVTRHAKTNARSPRWYHGADVPKAAIRRFARQIAEQFHPDKIILFGSYAYGTPHADSDVDILVVMPCRNELDQAVKISWAVEAPFSMNLIARTPYAMRWRLKEGDWFLREITSKGKVLYEAANGRMGGKSRGRFRSRATDRRRKNKRA
jgi:predicted nucleotidyltransferase